MAAPDDVFLGRGRTRSDASETLQFKLHFSEDKKRNLTELCLEFFIEIALLQKYTRIYDGATYSQQVLNGNSALLQKFCVSLDELDTVD